MQEYLKPLEIDTFLRQYTPKEKAYLAGNFADDNEVYLKYEELVEENGTKKKTYIFEDDFFLSSYENIGINKQDRFSIVHPHRHNYIELIYVWSGNSTQVINGHNVSLGQGDICILDTNTVHSVGIAEENDIIVNILMRKEFFASAFLNRMTKQGILAEFLINAMAKGKASKQYLLFKTLKDTGIKNLIEELLQEYYRNEIGKREVMESYIIILFTKILRLYRENPSHIKTQETNIKLLEILEYIEKNYETCTLDSAAEQFGFNGKYLTMLLKKKTGRSFVEHVQEQKLSKAKLLLINTNLPVTEVITLSGYHNTNFFYKKFRDSQGCTPAQYREKR